MHRFYADPEKSEADSFVLTPEDARHALKVLRMKEGEPAEIILEGKRYIARITEASDALVKLSPETLLPSTEPALAVTLFQGLPKGDKMDWIVQKAVELGVARIVPVAFSRCVVRLNEKDGMKKRDRWQKIAREAGKQSGRCVIPEVLSPVFPKDLQKLFCECEKVAVPWEECETGGPLAFARRYPALRTLGIVIGPEGGISPEEIVELKAFGGEPMTLGKRILRTETAGLAALSAFFGLYGEME
jgi:16S rRNA (uracil1498-N3)-methyltransferase